MPSQKTRFPNSSRAIVERYWDANTTADELIADAIGYESEVELPLPDEESLSDDHCVTEAWWWRDETDLGPTDFMGIDS